MVIIEVFWYKFRDEESGLIIDKNNKDELMTSLMKMIHEMEKRLGHVILYKMLMEQKIVFTELKYENK